MMSSEKLEPRLIVLKFLLHCENILNILHQVSWQQYASDKDDDSDQGEIMFPNHSKTSISVESLKNGPSPHFGNYVQSNHNFCQTLSFDRILMQHKQKVIVLIGIF